nr:type II toxin-antitoxin system HicA family toxin [Deinococcus sp. NW-56]
MNTRQRRTLGRVFEQPTRSDVAWTDVEALFRALGADITEGNGSRVRVALNGVRAVFHRPHPEKETDRGALVSVRRFLENAGVKP